MKWKRLILTWMVLVLAILVANTTDAAPKRGRDRAAARVAAAERRREQVEARENAIDNYYAKERARIRKAEKAKLPPAPEAPNLANTASALVPKTNQASMFESPDFTAIFATFVSCVGFLLFAGMHKWRTGGEQDPKLINVDREEEEPVYELDSDDSVTSVGSLLNLSGPVSTESDPAPSPAPVFKVRQIPVVPVVVVTPPKPARTVHADSVYVPQPLPAPTKTKRVRTTSSKPQRCAPFKPESVVAAAAKRTRKPRTRIVEETPVLVAVAAAPVPEPEVLVASALPELDVVPEPIEAAWMPDSSGDTPECPPKTETAQQTLPVPEELDSTGAPDHVAGEPDEMLSLTASAEEPEFPNLEAVPADFVLPGLLEDDGSDWLVVFRSEDPQVSKNVPVTH